MLISHIQRGPARAPPLIAVNVGCIPKKLMHTAGLLGEALPDAYGLGWRFDVAGHDWPGMVAAIQRHIGSLNRGYRKQARAGGAEAGGKSGRYAAFYLFSRPAVRASRPLLPFACSGAPSPSRPWHRVAPRAYAGRLPAAQQAQGVAHASMSEYNSIHYE